MRIIFEASCFSLFLYSALQAVARVLKHENSDALLHVENLSLTVVPLHQMSNVCVEESLEDVILCAINRGLVAEMFLHIVN